jgi:hypothetical protein
MYIKEIKKKSPNTTIQFLKQPFLLFSELSLTGTKGVGWGPTGITTSKFLSLHKKHFPVLHDSEEVVIVFSMQLSQQKQALQFLQGILSLVSSKHTTHCPLSSKGRVPSSDTRDMVLLLHLRIFYSILFYFVII